MADEIIFTAPDGATVLLSQVSGGGWEVIWGDPADGDEIADYAADGPSDDYQMVELTTADRNLKLAVWEDGAGRSWLSRHLIRAEAERLSEEAVTLARRDYAAAAALHAANELVHALLGCKELSPRPDAKDSALGDIFEAATQAVALCTQQAEQLRRAWEVMIAREQAAGRGVPAGESE